MKVIRKLEVTVPLWGRDLSWLLFPMVKQEGKEETIGRNEKKPDKPLK